LKSNRSDLLSSKAKGLQALPSHHHMFGTQYNRFVATIVTATKLHLQNIEGGMQRLSTLASAEARFQKKRWPFVTIPAFEAIGASVREQTGLEDIALTPFVTREDVDEWQRYSANNAKSWLRESRTIAESLAIKANASGEYHSFFVTTDYLDGEPMPYLVDIPGAFEKAAAGERFTYVASVKNNPDGPYLPYWMKSPPPFSPSTINVNFLGTDDFIPPFVSAVLSARLPLLAKTIDVTAIAQTGFTFEDHERYHASLQIQQHQVHFSAPALCLFESGL
jgi:hypothetical protein